MFGSAVFMTDKKFGLIGFPLANSFSKDYFTQKFAQQQLPNSYENFSLENFQRVKDLLAQKEVYSGFNVTRPYKTEIIGLLDELSEEAQACSAVNCISKTEAGKWRGHNTDVYGFQLSLESFLGSDRNLSALIIGNGGAAKAVQYVLNQLNIPYTFVGRNAKDIYGMIGYEELTPEIIRNNRLLIQCTPVGMHPHEMDCIQLPFEGVGKDHYAFDLIYLPAKTQFLANCEKAGANIKNGLEMLHLQADKAFDIWMKNIT